VRAAVETITETSVLAHLRFLASDELRGRDTPSEGLETAATYLVRHHRQNGLEPAGDDGTFFQRYPYRLVGSDVDGAQVAFLGPGGRVDLDVGRQAFVDGHSPAPLHAPLTFVRIQDSARPEDGALAGQVAVFSLPGDWSESLWSTSLDQASFAVASGAVAVVHVLDDAFPTPLLGQVEDVLAEPAWRLGEDTVPPRFFVREDAIRRAMTDGRLPWHDGRPDADAPVLTETIPALTLEARVPPNVVIDGSPPNVLARIPGSDPRFRDQYVVLSAHFDHVGVGRPVDGDSIYNGADDNASGTTALLEVARVLASLPPEDRPRRTLLFAHMSGEEKGLLGSQWWVEHPTVPLGSVVADVNIDMISGDTRPDTIAVLGQEYSSLGPLINEVNARHPELHLTTAPDLWPQEQLFFRSDQLNFMEKEIPTLFLFAGFHDCYHQPCDEVGFAGTSPEKAARVARLVAYTVLELANRDDAPEWKAEGLAEVRRLTSRGR
jgi:hypothetical protein